MKLSKAAAVLASIIVLSICLTVAGALWTYLTEYGGGPRVLAASVFVFGIGAAAIAYLLVRKYCRSRKSATVIIALLVALLVAPSMSMVYPGRITYSRFGLTVYGLIPIPYLDVTIAAHGGLWFRDKSHFISLDEVQPLLSSDVDALIVGTGWHGLATVDPAIRSMEGLEVRILSTPAAFELFNEYVSQRKTVVLVAHSTC